MSYVITLIAAQQAPFLEMASRIRKNTETGESRTFGGGRAMDIEAASPPSKDLMDDIRARFQADILWQDQGTRRKRLFVADMDATMVEEETLDELAGFAGIKSQIAGITARAMNGELDFKAALRERVALLKGLPVSALAETAAKMHFTPGGKKLIAALRANGVHCILVSGGFTFFTSKVAENLGFNAHFGNILDVGADQRLAGTVAEPVLDKAFKKSCLEENAAKLGIAMAQTAAIGDGANDLPMLQAAGLGVGFRSKQVLRDALPNHLLYNNLDALTYAFGL